MLVGAERFSYQGFLVMVLLFSALSMALIGVAELARLWLPLLPAVIYPLHFAAMMYIVFTFITANDRKIVRFMATGGSEMIVAMLTVAMFSATVLFGLVCQEIQVRTGGGFLHGDAADSWTWIGFGFDNLMEAALLDGPNIYGFSFTNVRASNFWTQTLVLIFRAAANLLIIRAAIRYFTHLRGFLFAERVEGRSR